jgi:hypothetical protein
VALLESLKETAFVMLEETFPSRDKGGNVYLDRCTGWFPSLEGLSAEDASVPIVPGGTTIAAHTFHTVFYLDVVMAELKGRSLGRVDWKESWVVSKVDAPAWDDLRRRLREAYEEVVALLEADADWGQAHVEVVMAAVTHSAYHLGAVRQFHTVLRAREVTD